MNPSPPPPQPALPASADASADDERLFALMRHWIRQTSVYALLLTDPNSIIVGGLGALEQVLGYRAEELVGQSLSVTFTEEDRTRGLDRHELLTAAASGRAEDDRWHVRREGTRVWIIGSLTALRDEGGRLVGFAKLMRDRTDLRAQIETLENRMQLWKTTEEEHERFLGVLAHELRNPLAPLTNAAELIRLLDKQGQMQRPLQIIDRQLALMTRLVGDLMDVTRIDTGKLALRIEPIELQATVRKAMESAHLPSGPQALSVELLLPEVPVVLEADAARVEQILVNLLNNAVKYSRPGGHVWIKATVEGGSAVIRILDNGMGIAPEMLSRIFDLFTQEARVSEAARGGLGIGLALVKNLVAAHHGVVEVRSNGRDKGSEFTVRLPLRQSA